MIEYLFDPQFVPAIQNGTKTQTIRRSHKNALHGCRAQLCAEIDGAKQVLIEATIQSVEPVQLWRDANGNVCIEKWGIPLSQGQIADVATKDGFGSKDEMCDWFEKRYGLPFSGYLHSLNEARQPTE